MTKINSKIVMRFLLPCKRSYHMQADYSEINPKLNSAVIALFPYTAHLHAFMRCVLFHPDYSPYISFGEQLTIAQHIVNDYKNHVLTVGAIYYYIACFVEKRNPAPPGITRSTLLSKPKKTTISDSGFSELFTESPLKQPLINNDPDITSQNIMSSLYNVFDKAAPPKVTQTIQQLYERSTQGTIYASQLSPTTTRQVPQSMEAFSDLFEDEKSRIPTQKIEKQTQSKAQLNFSNLFTPKTDTTKNRMASPSGSAAQIVAPIIETKITTSNLNSLCKKLFLKK